MTLSEQRKRGRNRKHDHFRVIVTYTDGDKSIKVFTDRRRAEKFAARQERFPVIKSVEIVKLK